MCPDHWILCTPPWLFWLIVGWWGLFFIGLIVRVLFGTGESNANEPEHSGNSTSYNCPPQSGDVPQWAIDRYVSLAPGVDSKDFTPYGENGPIEFRDAPYYDDYVKG